MQIYPDSRVVNTDIELAAIQSVALVLGPHVTPQGCVYQLSQSTGREIQAVGKTYFYRTNDDSKHFCGMLDGLAFFPEDKVQVGMTCEVAHTRRYGGVSRLILFNVCNWNLSSCSTRTSTDWSSSTTTTRPEHSTTVRHTHLDCAPSHSGGTGPDE